MCFILNLAYYRIFSEQRSTEETELQVREFSINLMQICAQKHQMHGNIKCKQHKVHNNTKCTTTPSDIIIKGKTTSNAQQYQVHNNTKCITTPREQQN